MAIELKPEDLVELHPATPVPDQWDTEEEFSKHRDKVLSFEGLRGHVVEVIEGSAYIAPLTDRPDGFERSSFFWNINELELVERKPKS